jgi:3-methyladenine DNA glycosylase AlkD
MTTSAILNRLCAAIIEHDKPINRLNYQRFFKEKLKDPYGLKTSILRKISNDCFKELKGRSKNEILEICDQLLEAGQKYFRFFAFEWAGKFKSQYEKNDLNLFEVWLKNYVDGWSSCDHLCGGPLGNLFIKYPASSKRTVKWARSKSMWQKRAAAVSLILPVRNGLLLDRAFEISDLLLADEDDLVQKGYGWMLKEANERFPVEVFDYIMKNKQVMPRTALRYAIEKMAEAKRRQAMSKE